MIEGLIKFISVVIGGVVSVWLIAKAIASKKEPLKVCVARLDKMEKEIDHIKQSDTEKIKLIAGMQAQLALIQANWTEMKAEFKQQSKTTEEQAMTLAVLTEKVETILRTHDQLRGETKEILTELRKFKNG